MQTLTHSFKRVHCKQSRTGEQSTCKQQGTGHWTTRISRARFTDLCLQSLRNKGTRNTRWQAHGVDENIRAQKRVHANAERQFHRGVCKLTEYMQNQGRGTFIWNMQFLRDRPTQYMQTLKDRHIRVHRNTRG